MRRLLCVLVMLSVPAIAFAQAQAQAPATPPAIDTFMSAADVTALIAKARTSRRPDQPNYIQPILQLAPYRANLEYRVAGLNAPAAVHERDAEMFYVIEGAGTLVTGGALRDGAIDGGKRQRVGQGDFVIVPENTPHWFGEIDGALVLMSIHVPRTGGSESGR